MFPGKPQERSDWVNLVGLVTRQLPIIMQIQPLLTKVAEWVQVLSGSQWCTISLVRVAIRAIKVVSDNLDKIVEGLQDLGDEESLRLAEPLDEFLNSFCAHFTHYFGADYADYWLFMVAAYLDPRAVQTEADFASLEKAIKENCCLPHELRVPLAAAALQPLDPNAPPLTAMERRLLELRAAVPAALSCLVDMEFASYTAFLVEGAAAAKAMEPLDFWAQDTCLAKWPILSRITAQYLCVPACSSGVERFFSVAGRIVTPLRNRLSGSLVNQLCVLHNWLQSEISTTNNNDTRRAKRSRNAASFATLSAGLVLERGTTFDYFVEGEESDEDDLEEIMLDMDYVMEGAEVVGETERAAQQLADEEMALEGENIVQEIGELLLNGDLEANIEAAAVEDRQPNFEERRVLRNAIALARDQARAARRAKR
jgi:hypothetical protein